MTLAISAELNGAAYPGKLTDKVIIGDIHLVSLRRWEQAEKYNLGSNPRPMIVWGVYRDNHGKVVSVDALFPAVIPNGKERGFTYTSSLKIESEKERELAGVPRPQIVNLNTLWNVDWVSVGKGGFVIDNESPKGRVKEDLFPHLAICRMNGILLSPTSKYIKTGTAHACDLIYEGLEIPIAPEKILSGVIPPEIDCQCERKKISNVMGLDKYNIAELLFYHDNKMSFDRHRNKATQFPRASVPVQKWPHWDQWSAGIIFPAASASSLLPAP